MPATPALRRDLGFWSMAGLGVSMMLGSGIFFGPTLTAREFPDARIVLALWAAGGAIAIAGAWVFGRIGARRPMSGGPYAFLRESYGPLVAHLYGWTSLAIIAPTSMAVIAGLLAGSLGALLPMTGLAAALVALAAIALFALVNLAGVRSGGRVQAALSALKVALLIGLLALVAWGGRSAAPPEAPWAGTGRWSVAFVGVLFAYGGWEYAVLASEDVRDAPRNVPRGLMAGAIVVTALYLAAVLAYLAALGADGVARATALAPEAAGRVSPLAGGLTAIAVGVSAAGTLNAILLLGPRATFALARDGTLPPALARLSRRAAVPAIAILFQAELAALYLLAGSAARVASFTVVGTGVFIVLSSVALLRDRAFRPAKPAVRALEAAAVAIVAGSYAWFLVFLVFEDPGTALTGLGIILAGTVPYALMRAWSRSRRRRERAPA